MTIKFGLSLMAMVAALCLPVMAAAAPQARQPEPYIVLNYHDIPENGQKVGPFDRMAVASRNFGEHVDWLLANGYHFVSIQQIIDAHAGKANLPDKAVLLTFDEFVSGTEIFGERIQPLMQCRRHIAPVARAAE